MSRNPTPDAPLADVLEQLAAALIEPGIPRAAWRLRLASLASSFAGIAPLAVRLRAAEAAARALAPPPADLAAQLQSLAHGLRIGAPLVARKKLLRMLEAWASGTAAGNGAVPESHAGFESVLLVDPGPVSRALTARLIRKIGRPVMEFIALEPALDALRRGEGHTLLVDPLHLRIPRAELVEAARGAARDGRVELLVFADEDAPQEIDLSASSGIAAVLGRPPREESLRAALAPGKDPGEDL